MSKTKKDPFGDLRAPGQWEKETVITPEQDYLELTNAPLKPVSGVREYQLNVVLDRARHKKVRMYCLNHDLTITDFVKQVIDAL